LRRKHNSINLYANVERVSFASWDETFFSSVHKTDSHKSGAAMRFCEADLDCSPLRQLSGAADEGQAGRAEHSAAHAACFRVRFTQFTATVRALRAGPP